MNEQKYHKRTSIYILGLTLIACSHRSGQTTNNSAQGVQISNNQSSTTESKGEK